MAVNASNPSLEAIMKDMVNKIAFGSAQEFREFERGLYKFKMSDKVAKAGYAGLRPFYQNYLYPADGSEFQQLSLLHVAVLTGDIAMVEEVMRMGVPLEKLTGNTLDKGYRKRTARGLADVLIERSKTPEEAANFKAIKKLLLQRGAQPKTVTTWKGTKLVFPENAADVQYYKNATAELNRMFPLQKSRKNRKAKKTRKTRRLA